MVKYIQVLITDDKLFIDMRNDKEENGFESWAEYFEYLFSKRKKK